MAPGDRNLRDWIPWPHLIANDVHVGNPAHMKQADMAAVKQFSFSLNPLGLLHHTIGIPVLRFDAPRVDLVRTDPSHYNWVYKKEEKESKWKLDLERVVLTDGVVRFVDAVTKADVTAHVRTLANDPKYGISFEVGGSYNGAPVTGGGKVGLGGRDQRAVGRKGTAQRLGVDGGEHLSFLHAPARRNAFRGDGAVQRRRQADFAAAVDRPLLRDQRHHVAALDQSGVIRRIRSAQEPDQQHDRSDGRQRQQRHGEEMPPPPSFAGSQKCVECPRFGVSHSSRSPSAGRDRRRTSPRLPACAGE